LKNVIL